MCELKLKCPKCKETGLRRMINLIVYAPADTRDLGKTHLRSKDIEIMGASWDTSLLYCPKCGWGNEFPPMPVREKVVEAAHRLSEIIPTVAGEQLQSQLMNVHRLLLDALNNLPEEERK